MEETEEGEARSKSGTPSLPVKRSACNAAGERTGKKKKTSGSNNLDRYPLRLRNPDLSNCHVCDSQILARKGKDKLQTLDSQWRIVIICGTCLTNVQSAKVCAYCFTEMSELGVNCRICCRRIHVGCMPMFGRLNPWSNLGSFTCIDCWVPKSINNITSHGKKKGSNRAVSKSKSKSSPLDMQPSFGVSSSPSDSSSKSIEVAGKDAKSTAAISSGKSLEVVANDAKSTAAMKQANAAKAKEKALEKAAAARQAAEMAANVLDLAAVAASEESQVDGRSPLVDDADLALRLHRVMNSSPRIFRNMRSVKLDNLVNPNKMKVDSCTLATQSDPGSQIAQGLDVRTDNLVFANPGKAASEPSVQIGSINHDSSIDLGELEPRIKTPKEGHVYCRRKGGFGRKLNSVWITDAGNVKMSDYQDSVVELSMKEDQASCSGKVTISCGNNNATDSGSRCCQNQEGMNDNVVVDDGGTQCQSVCEESSMPEERSSKGRDMFLRKYSRRCRGDGMYLKKYSRRSTNTKGNNHVTTNVPPGTFHGESRASDAALPLLEIAKGTHAQSLLSQASTSASNQS